MILALKITDFGLSKFLSEESKGRLMTTPVGSLGYMAPVCDEIPRL
jgi:serine/threonine protein kinase